MAVRRRLRALLPGLVIALAAIALLAAGERIPALQAVEGQSLTWRFRVRGPVAPGPEVVLVVIDDATIAGLGRWPLPRSVLADATAALAADGARVIAFDLLFAEPQADLPPAVVQALRQARNALPADAAPLAGRIDRLLGAAGPDRRLAEALAATDRAVLPFAFAFESEPGTAVAVPPVLARTAIRIYRLPPGGDGPAPAPAGMLAPRPALARAAATLGHVSVILDADGILRHEHPVIGFRGDYYPSLALEAARLYRGLPRDAVAVRFGESIALGDRIVPTDGRTRLIVNHYGPRGTFEAHGLDDVVAGRVPAGTFAGRIALIGATATGIGDTFAGPYGPTLPGTEYYATVLDNLLHDRVVVRTPAMLAIDAAAILAGSLAAGLIGAAAGLRLASLAGVALLVGGWGAAATAAFSAGNLWLGFVYPALAMVLTYAWYAAARAMREQRSRRVAERERANLARYLPPSIVDRLARSDRPFAADRTQHAAILFVDIVDFTRTSERMAPAAAMALLRAFHGRVERAVFAHDGMLDKFLGDGALAVFGVAEPDVADARDAVLCARTLVEDIAAWREELAARGEPPLTVGIGLHCGPVLVGAIGGERQFQFTVIGDAVNVASRLNELTRTLGADIVASDAVIEAARAAGGEAAVAGFTPLPPEPLRGRTRPLGIWAWRGPEAAGP